MECLGLTGNEIKNKVEQVTLDKHYRGDLQPKESLVDKLQDGNTLFLRSVDDIATVKRLAGIVRNNKDCGMLIVTATPNSVPDDFLKLYHVIHLEDNTPASATANPTGQATPEARDRASTPQIPAGATANEPKSTTQRRGFVPFPTPAGTKWHEVGMVFIDDENVKMIARDISEVRHFSQMGFRKGKTTKAVASWHVLKLFSENDCLKYPEANKSKTEKVIQDLRKRLKTLFGIQDDPIVLEHGYKPVFKVYKTENENRSVKAFTNNDFFDERDD